MMGGSIWVEGRPGNGSVFHFTARFEVQSGGRREAFAPVELRGLDVLVVDDNATNRRILGEMLRGWGMKATLVEGAGEAMAVLDDQADPGPRRFDLVILDCNMPEMDGFTLAEQIREHAIVPCRSMMML